MTQNSPIKFNTSSITPISRSANKCATMGCHREKVEESDFCARCLAERVRTPLCRRTCDNLTAVSDE